MTDFSDPAARHALLEALGPAEYNRRFAAHQQACVTATVNGYLIRTSGSRFGVLFAVDDTGTAFPTLEAARVFARTQPARRPDPLTSALTDEYARYLAEHQLPAISADELLHEDLAPTHRQWVTNFLSRWAVAEDLERGDPPR